MAKNSIDVELHRVKYEWVVHTIIVFKKTVDKQYSSFSTSKTPNVSEFFERNR